jgi:hypothetical protein
MQEPEFWLESTKAWEQRVSINPLESYCFEPTYQTIPNKFKMNLWFNRELIQAIYGFYHVIPDEFKSDFEICREVLSKNGLMLEFMPECIQRNAELAAVAIRQNPMTTPLIADELSYNIAFIKQIIDENSMVLDYANSRMKYLYEASKTNNNNI